MDGELLEVDAAGDAIEAAQPDGRVAGYQHDERGGELLHRAGAGERPDPELLEHGVGRRLEAGQ